MINLISDTVTQPTPAMREAMLSAPVGDDVFGQDPSINALQDYAAQLFGKPAALFCPSGTMTNQIAIKCHTQPLDEVICDKTSHVYQYETAGYAFHSGVSMNLLNGQNGKITAAQVAAAVKPRYDWLPISKLVIVENTCNKGGGSIYRLPEVTAIREVCDQHDLRLHLDGARLFNALVETEESPTNWGAVFDSISICLSKGLGAPVGSLLIGDQQLIDRARRYRKVMGGGMRQAGILAAAGQFALENNVERLRVDNARARRVGTLLKKQSYVTSVRPVASNIIIFDLAGEQTAAQFLSRLEAAGILGTAFGPQTIRLTFHLHVDDAAEARLLEVLQKM
ncbi:MAG: GntG family PLP-dependent aldolase [Bacteroidota bacterium]